jgi:hypothetical protein
MRRGLRRVSRVVLLLCLLLCIVACVVAANVPQRVGAQRARRRGARAQPAKVCFDPVAPCPTSLTFEPHDLKFRLPRSAVVFDSEEFYAVVLKTLRVDNADCEKFVPESERLEAQTFFPHRKVFASRCVDTLSVYYSNVAPNERIMALYAGATRAEAVRTLEEVKATGKFPDAKLRRMHASINGT